MERHAQIEKSVLGSIWAENYLLVDDDRAGLTVSQMRAAARKVMHTEPKLKPIIFVDYLQIIRGNFPGNNQTEVVGQISNELKQMEKEFNCPVVCLSQLNRGVESRDNKTPRHERSTRLRQY